MTSRWKQAVARFRDYLRQHTWAQWVVPMVVLLLIMGTGGLLVAVSGIVPIKASSGHFAITHWFLNFAKERSVATHSSAITPPPLDDPALVLRGAGHYEIGCRLCHGSPDLHHPPIPHRMLPPPPYLPETVHKWKPQELFYMVKHGIKMTGMPAWPTADRDDEIWAMVAFLRVFPELDAKRYRELVHGESASAEPVRPLTNLESIEASVAAIAKTCASCHGADGLGRHGGMFPKLAGQRRDYLIASLEAFAQGKRFSGTMEPVAAGLSSTQIRELARHFTGLQGTRSKSSQQTDQLKRGQEIAEHGLPKQDVPACNDCHSSSEGMRNSLYPALAGQPAAYLVEQLVLFKAAKRGGTSNAHLMRHVAEGLTVEQMRDVASYLEALSKP